MIERTGAAGELRRLLEIRVPELIAYQDEAYAQQYVDFIKAVMAAEKELVISSKHPQGIARSGLPHPGPDHDGDLAIPVEQLALSEAVARYLFKLMAYKDEYEVARLHLKPELAQTLAEQFGDDAQKKYQLHPPLLRAMGLKNKIGFGRWFEPGFRLLASMKKLRGTRLDMFGYTEMRRLERTLIGEYRALVEDALAGLSPETYDRTVKLAELPDMIRGYEDVKLKNIERYRREVQKLVGEKSQVTEL
jgi:indolepyruvate ferredoxin oxidoreductase